MDFEWDPGKARDNLRKHGEDFADAVIALEDENALTIEDPGHAEPRFKTLGMGPTLDVLFSRALRAFERSNSNHLGAQGDPAGTRVLFPRFES